MLFPECFHHELIAALTRSSDCEPLKRETYRSVVEVRRWPIASAIWRAVRPLRREPRTEVVPEVVERRVDACVVGRRVEAAPLDVAM